MNRQKIRDIIEKINMGDFPIPMEIKLAPETSDGKTYVSVGLHAADVLAVKSGLKAGGFCPWPPHLVEIGSDDEFAVLVGVRTARDRALSHEADEHMKYAGKLLNPPHPGQAAVA